MNIEQSSKMSFCIVKYILLIVLPAVYTKLLFSYNGTVRILCVYRTFVNFVPIKTGQKPKPLVAGPTLCEGVHENRDWTRKRRAAISSFSLRLVCEYNVPILYIIYIHVEFVAADYYRLS